MGAARGVGQGGGGVASFSYALSKREACERSSLDSTHLRHFMLSFMRYAHMPYAHHVFYQLIDESEKKAGKLKVIYSALIRNEYIFLRIFDISNGHPQMP